VEERRGSFAWGARGGLKHRDRYFVDGGQTELGIKRRAEKKGEKEAEIEIKGLVALMGPAREHPFEGTIQLWTKWKVRALTLDASPSLLTEKTRWLRKFAIEDTKITEIRLNEDETPHQGGGRKRDAMLNSPRSNSTKCRILGRRGHLASRLSVTWIASVLTSG
jgi:hypothetical protein